MSEVDPGEGYRLLVEGDTICWSDEFCGWDGEWKEANPPSIGIKFDVDGPRYFRPYRRRIENPIPVTNSGPYVAIEVHRAALAEVERLKAELDKRCEIWRISRDIAANERDAAESEVKRLKAELKAVKQPQPSGKPQSGEWWLNDNGERVRIVGWSSAGRLYVEYECGTVLNRKPANTHDWKHLPKCTGWDWQPEPEPEWFDLTPFGDHRLRKEIDQYEKHHDDVWLPIRVYEGATIDGMKQIWGSYQKFRCLLKDAPPELVAMASKPAEDPDEWVTQDRVAPRVGIDHFRWCAKDSNGPWNRCDKWNVFPCGPGGTDPTDGLRLELRCRRRDLPPMPEQPKAETVVFYEVIRTAEDNFGNEEWVLQWTSDPLPPDIKTGRTETREVVR